MLNDLLLLIFPDVLHNKANLTCDCPTQCNNEVYEVRVSSITIRTDLTTMYDPF